jgi:ABC-type Fe3+/spermidine/putrescine transport system ATPase subunit
LRSIAGIVTPDEGQVFLAGEDITNKPIYARNIAFVFQNYALFTHLSVFHNVAFGLKMRKVPRPDICRRVAAMLDLVRLPDMADRLPSQLSSGQQQRVALARALVVEPAVLLLDEPLSNLDARLREEMRDEIRRLQRALGVATILVTHDIDEAFAVADRVAVMQNGKIAQVGTPREIYAAPQSRFVAEFVGRSNLFEAKVCAIDGGSLRLRLVDGVEVEAAADGSGWHLGDKAWLMVAPNAFASARLRLRAATALPARSRRSSFSAASANTPCALAG